MEMDISAVILAGGQSRRMGRDKAWLEVEGEPLIKRILHRIRDAGIHEVLISGRAGADYSDLKCPVLFDLEPGLGPLSGIERGLAAANSPLVLVLAVDLPHMSTEFILREKERCDSLTGVVPRRNRQLEPLAAIYPKRCHVIAAGLQRKFCWAAREFAARCLSEHAVRPFAVSPADEPCFQNWNQLSDIAPETDHLAQLSESLLSTSRPSTR